MRCIIHDYRKIDETDEPKYILYYADSCVEKGVYACKCLKCGKKKDVKIKMPIVQYL